MSRLKYLFTAILLLIGSQVCARECYVTKNTKRIDAIKSCDPVIILRDVVPVRGIFDDSVHLYEFVNANLYKLTIISPDFGMGLPRITGLEYEYKKVNGNLILKLLTDKPDLQCTQYFKFSESNDEMLTVNDGLDGACKVARITYKQGLKIEYKKIVE